MRGSGGITLLFMEFIVCASLFLIPLPTAQAQTCPPGDILCSPVNLITGSTGADRDAVIARIRSEGVALVFLNLITKFASVAAIFAAVGLIYGGLLYVISHGNDEQLTKAKQFIMYTIFGLVGVALTHLVVLVIRDLLYAQPIV